MLTDNVDQKHNPCRVKSGRHRSKDPLQSLNGDFGIFITIKIENPMFGLHS